MESEEVYSPQSCCEILLTAEQSLQLFCLWATNMEAGWAASALEGNLDLFFFFGFSSFILLCDTQNWITTTPSVPTAQTNTWQRSVFKSHRQRCHKTRLISRVLWSIPIVCVLKAIGRRQDSCLPPRKKKGAKVWCGKICLKVKIILVQDYTYTTRYWFLLHKILHHSPLKQRTSCCEKKDSEECLEYREPADNKWQRHFWEGKVVLSPSPHPPG